MKTYFGLILLLVSTAVSHGANTYYELLWASSPTGPWHHMLWTTNVTSVDLPKTNPAAFYRVFEAQTPPPQDPVSGQVFDYSFYGTTNTSCPSVTGTLNLGGFSGWDSGLTGTYHLSQDACYVPISPLGAGYICGFDGCSYVSGSDVHIVLTCNYPGTYLAGSWSYGLNGSGKTVPIIYGHVWANGFSGEYNAGTFIAVGR
jgi:hypothetical protein